MYLIFTTDDLDLCRSPQALINVSFIRYTTQREYATATAFFYVWTIAVRHSEGPLTLTLILV